MNIKEIVTQRKLAIELRDTCPYCGESGIETHGETTTLLAWYGGANPNHRWQKASCPACKQEFTRELKDENVWFTAEDGFVLCGMPSCFEPYLYTCIKCGGRVHREQTSLDGGPTQYLSSIFEDGKLKNLYRTFYVCGSCGNRGEIDHE